MAKVLSIGVYMADRPNTAAHITYEFACSADHKVIQRWIALAPDGRGRYDLPGTELVVTDRIPKFTLLNELAEDALDFDWVLICDDDIEVGSHFVDKLIGQSDRFDLALSQPARTIDSFTDHPIVQVMPGLVARRTRFVEIGPLTCMRRDAVQLLLPFAEIDGMGWGLDFIWPRRIESAGLRMGIIDAAPLAHRIRPPVSNYNYANAHRAMSMMLARQRHLTVDEAFTVLEAYA